MCRRTAPSAPSAPFDFERVDLYVVGWPVLGIAGDLRDFLDNVVSFHNFTENAVLVIEVRSGGYRDEELAAVGVWSGVCHREQARFGMFQRGVEFVPELVTGAAAAGALRASTLNHEVGNHAMKD